MEHLIEERHPAGRERRGGAWLPWVLSLFIVVYPLSVNAVVLAPEYERLQPLTSHVTSPTALAVDSQGNLYVSESSRNRVVRFDRAGSYLDDISGLDRPISLALSPGGEIYIGNAGRGNVEVYDSDLNLLMKLGCGDGEFGQPSGIAVGRSGLIYVADSREDRVKIYRREGSFLSSFGGTGVEGGKFRFPSAITVDEARGEVIVTDFRSELGVGEKYGGARVQVFDAKGEPLREFGRFGLGESMLVKPLGVEVDGEGRIYVADAFRNVVQVYGGDGSFLTTIYDEEEPLRTPLGIAYGELSGKLFVASLSRGRIEVYRILSPAAQRTLTTAVSGTGDGYVLSDPPGIECGGTCAAAFQAGTTVTLTAVPLAGSVFSGWSGDCSGTGACEVVMGEDRDVGAAFSPLADKAPTGRDFNGDGLSDLLLWDPATGAVSIWITKEGGPSLTHALDDTEEGTLVRGAADFDGDGKTEILLRDSRGNVFLRLVEGGTLTAVVQVDTLRNPNWAIVDTADFDGDGKADILWRHLRSGALTLWTMDGSSVVSRTRVAHSPRISWRIAGTADFDGDGKADILWEHTPSGALLLWFMNGPSVDGEASLGDSLPVDWEIVGTDDFNGDGYGEILWQNRKDGELYLWLIAGPEGAGAFPVAHLHGPEWQVVGSGDYNGDGIADIVARQDGTGEVALWLMGRTGVTASIAVGVAPGRVFIW